MKKGEIFNFIIKNGKISENVILKNCYIYPGSFNPLHKGHLSLEEYSVKLKKMDFFYDISLSCPDN